MRKGIFKTLWAFAFLCLIGYTVFSFNRIKRLEEKVGLLEKKLGGERELVCDEKKAIEKARQATVRISGTYADGTGFLVKENGMIITNFHVIEFEPAPKVILPNYDFKTAEVMLGDKNSDLAILKIEGENYPFLDLGDSKVLEEMDRLYVIGYPLGLDLAGEATVNQGRFVTWRTVKDKSIKYIQIDSAINPGNSGGPIITSCGEVVGVATAGVSGLGMGISSESAKEEWFAMFAADKKPEIKTIAFEPEKGPKEAVEAFYNYIKLRKLREAFDLLSKERIGDLAFDDWVKGYDNTLDVFLVDIYEVEESKDEVFVKLQSKDLVGQNVEYRYFEGTWQVNKEGDKYLLNQSKIEEIEDPLWEWFIPKEYAEDF